MRPSHRRLAAGRLVKKLKLALWALAASVPLQTQAGVSVWSETSRVGMGVSSMSEAQSRSLLVEYFKDFLEKRDVDEFRNRVALRYNEGTLGRILAGSPDVSARRAAVLALGILGSFEQSNPVLGKALRDDDLAVRSMAEDALWADLVSRRYARAQSDARAGAALNQPQAARAG